jgi:hypothetical protein
MQYRVVAAKPTDELTETADCARYDVAVLSVRHFRRRRELLGVVGHHEHSPVPFSFDPIGVTPLAAPSFPSVSGS